MNRTGKRTRGTSYSKKAGKPTTTGHRERLTENQIRAMQLRIEGNTYEEIAFIIYREQNLPHPPGTTTIAEWLERAHGAYQANLQALQVQYREIQSNHYDRMCKRLDESFFAPNLRIERRQMEDGKMVSVLDEGAAKELAALGKTLINARVAQAKLWGLNLEKPSESSEDTPPALIDIHMMIIQWSHKNASEKPAIDVQAEVLELETGLDEGGASL